MCLGFFGEEKNRSAEWFTSLCVYIPRRVFSELSAHHKLMRGVERLGRYEGNHERKRWKFFLGGSEMATEKQWFSKSCLKTIRIFRLWRVEYRIHHCIVNRHSYFWKVSSSVTHLTSSGASHTPRKKFWALKSVMSIYWMRDNKFHSSENNKILLLNETYIFILEWSFFWKIHASFNAHDSQSVKGTPLRLVKAMTNLQNKNAIGRGLLLHSSTNWKGVSVKLTIPTSFWGKKSPWESASPRAEYR